MKKEGSRDREDAMVCCRMGERRKKNVSEHRTAKRTRVGQPLRALERDGELPGTDRFLICLPLLENRVSL